MYDWSTVAELITYLYINYQVWLFSICACDICIEINKT